MSPVNACSRSVSQSSFIQSHPPLRLLPPYVSATERDHLFGSDRPCVCVCVCGQWSVTGHSLVKPVSSFNFTSPPPTAQHVSWTHEAFQLGDTPGSARPGRRSAVPVDDNKNSTVVRRAVPRRRRRRRRSSSSSTWPPSISNRASVTVSLLCDLDL